MTSVDISRWKEKRDIIIAGRWRKTDWLTTSTYVVAIRSPAHHPGLGTIHLLRKHIFMLFGPNSTLRKHIFNTKCKQKLPFSNLPSSPSSKCLHNIWMVPYRSTGPLSARGGWAGPNCCWSSRLTLGRALFWATPPPRHLWRPLQEQCYKPHALASYL